MNNREVHDLDSLQGVAKAVAQAVEAQAKLAIAQRGVFHWALAGGTTPKQCYYRLRQADMDWSKVHVWFGDERCLPVGDDERNDVMADEALLKHVPIPESQIHRIPAELGADKAAAYYAQALSKIDALDLVLLGMGEDGHTASLFPNNIALRDEGLAVAVFDAPKPPPERVSLGYRALKAARQRIIMVTGEAKREAWRKVQTGEALPVNIADSVWYIAV